jgi:phosphomannomutase/phosphoglucomutase
MKLVENAFSEYEMVTVDGVRIRLTGDDWKGWFLCRPSNTEPILVMRAEATTEAGLTEIRALAHKKIGKFIDLKKFDES